MNTNAVTTGQDPIMEIFLRLAVEIAVLLIILPVIYGRSSGRKEHMFSFFLMGMIIFTMCALLKNVQIQMGMVLGLFAIFSIVRFRTINFSTKDMSYLFAILGLSAINAMFDFPHPVRGTIIFNSIIILTILILELGLKNVELPGDRVEVKKKKKKDGGKPGKEKKEKRHVLVYDNLQLLSPDLSGKLKTDISKRTGLEIKDVRIRKIDLTKNNAVLEIIVPGNEKKEKEEDIKA